jgi:hypothetical protein
MEDEWTETECTSFADSWTSPSSMFVVMIGYHKPIEKKDILPICKIKSGYLQVD